jgi:hypothetical protein
LQWNETSSQSCLPPCFKGPRKDKKQQTLENSNREDCRVYNRTLIAAHFALCEVKMQEKRESAKEESVL